MWALCVFILCVERRQYLYCVYNGDNIHIVCRFTVFRFRWSFLYMIIMWSFTYMKVVCYIYIYSPLHMSIVCIYIVCRFTVFRFGWKWSKCKPKPVPQCQGFALHKIRTQLHPDVVTGVSRHNGEKLRAPLKAPNTIECYVGPRGFRGCPGLGRRMLPRDASLMLAVHPGLITISRFALLKTPL